MNYWWYQKIVFENHFYRYLQEKSFSQANVLKQINRNFIYESFYRIFINKILEKPLAHVEDIYKCWFLWALLFYMC